MQKNIAQIREHKRRPITERRPHEAVLSHIQASQWETTKPGQQRHSLNHLHMSLNMISQD